MKLIFLFFIVNDVVSFIFRFKNCTSINLQREICAFAWFNSFDVMNLCFKPGPSFKNLKIQGYPNYNYIFKEFSWIKFVNDLNHYETIAIDRLKVNEWNYLQVVYDEEPYDSDTNLRIYTCTLNGEELTFKVPLYFGNSSYYNFGINDIYFLFEGEWKGSRNFSVSKRRWRINSNIYIFNISNCDGVEISNYLKYSNESALKESASNKSGLIVGCIFGSFVGIILMMTVIIYIKIRRRRLEKESVYYEQYPEEYELYKTPTPTLVSKVE